MRMTKKLFTTLLALAMAMALALPAFAAGPAAGYSITITNDQAGHTYEAYQIFAGTVSSDDMQTEGNGDTTGPMLGDITWGDNIQDTAGLIQALIDSDIEAFAGLDADTSTAADVAQALVVAADAAAFADIVVNYLAGEPTGETNTHVEDARYVIDGLPSGYYLVKDVNVPQTGTATDYIVQVLGNVTMEPKDTDIPTLEKKVVEDRKYQQDGGYGATFNDVADYDIGDRVQFKLIGSIPDMTAYDTYTYVFHDTLPKGLTLDPDSFDVYVAYNKNDNPALEGWTELGAEYYTIEPTDTENGGGSFTVTFNDLKTVPNTTDGDHKYIYVSYYTTLNTNAEIGLDGNVNSASLEFSNDPNDETSTGQTTEDTVIVFTYGLDGTKVDGEDGTTRLEGAQFVLLSSGKTEAAVVVDDKMSEWLKVDTEAAAGDTKIPETYDEWVELNKQHPGLIITSDETGLFNIAGLDNGTYYLREIKAPDGYNLLEEDVELVITATTANGQDWDGVPADALTGLTVTTQLGEDGIVTEGEGNVDTGIVAITVANNQGATLPETGGMGTTLFYIIGGVLVVAAVVVLVARRRAGGREE